MRGPSVPADPLRVVSRAEAVALSDGLRRHAERKPKAAEDPVMVLLTRLIISLPEEDHEQKHRLETEGIVAEQARELRALETENTTLRKDNGILVERLSNQPAPTSGPTQSDLDDRDARLKLANLACDYLRESLDKLQAEAIRVADEDQKEEAASTALIADLEERLTKVIAKKDQGNQYLVELRGRVRSCKDIVEKKQWSAKHKRHRSQKGRASACPVCGGLSTEYDHKDAGHKKGCIMEVLSTALSK